MPIIPALRRLRQENGEFEVRPCLKKQKIIKKSWSLVAHAVILAIQEAKIRRIVVQSQPRKTVLKTLSRKYPKQKKGQWGGSSGRASA
jgi:hypothetical protein